jgi:hypothetical protein
MEHALPTQDKRKAKIQPEKVINYIRVSPSIAFCTQLVVIARVEPGPPLTAGID